MKSPRLGFVILCLVAGNAQAQSPHFIVASVKPALPPRDVSELAIHRDPGRVAFGKVNLATLAVNATNLSRDLITGPDWMDSTWFEFSATTPTDTTNEQLLEMFQHFLEERFAFKYHLESQELRGYGLTVGPHGARLKPAQPIPADGKAPAFSWSFDGPQDGVRTGHLPNCSMRMLAQAIASVMNGRPIRGRSDATIIADRTGLNGRYDMTLNIEDDHDDNGGISAGVVRHALETQLGLTLAPATIVRKRAIIDHAERTPTLN